MTQLDLLSSAVSERRPRRHRSVPRTSVEAGRAVNRDGRVALVLDWLALREFAGDRPTSAELASWINPTGSLFDVLYVRRGLSDALARGFVEHAGERVCAVSGRKCVTWRLRTR